MKTFLSISQPKGAIYILIQLKGILLFWAAVFPPHLKKAHLEIGYYIKTKGKTILTVRNF